MADELPGTRFLKLKAPKDGRKKWLLAGPKSTGQLVIDDGAIVALKERGASLLAKGVKTVRGCFERGDFIDVVSSQGQYIAKGLVNFDHQEIDQIKGCHSSQITELLTFASSSEVIHRDDMILL